MPIMDGITCTKYLRMEMNIETPIVAFTANAFEEDLNKCFSAGMVWKFL